MPQAEPTTIDLSGLSLDLAESRVFDLGLFLPPVRLAGQDYRFVPDRVPARVTVTFVGHGYQAAIEFSCSLQGACWRCLEPAVIDLDVREEDFFEAEPQPSGEPGEGDEPSPWYQEDGLLNLSLWGRDAVVGMLPPQILCGPECRGLCPQCGANLNLEECGCEPAGDSRWEKLKRWGPEE